MSISSFSSLSQRLAVLRQGLDATLSQDRPALARQLARLRSRLRDQNRFGTQHDKGHDEGRDGRAGQSAGPSAKDGSEGLVQAVEALSGRIAASVAAREARAARLPAPNFPEALPVSARREEIAAAIQAHQVVVVCGETGSGKTTQLPKICLSVGRGAAGLIGHTQPRRIAARSVASRIAEELHSPLGELVGYKVRFHDRTRRDSVIKLMTDGILLAEAQHDPLLSQYDTLIIDEAHERSLNIDFLLGYLKQLLPRRPDLKLIITSATIDPQRFAAHFDGAPIIEVSGRTYPVEVWYRPPETLSDDSRTPASQSAGREGESEQTRAILAAVDELARYDRSQNRGPGDILVFLAGEREIRETAEALRKHHPAHTEILPLFSRLSVAEQQRVFQPHAGRRIVLATNVAETSLTVPGIRYVIDPGMARISRYSVRSQVQRLPIENISQASADQRKGRCGRVSAGVCIRLYSEADFLAREPYTPPEIQRTHLAGVILQMQALGLGEVERFPFIDPPEARAVNNGYRLLHELGAIEPDVGGKRRLTGLGQRLARLPVDVRLGRMLLTADTERSLTEVSIIVAVLAVQDPRERPLEAQAAADEAHQVFVDPRSDFLSLLALWRAYQDRKRHLSGNKLRQWCRGQFLAFMRLREWEDIHHQLLTQAREMGLRPNEEPADYAAIHRALLSGLLGHVACRDEVAPAPEKTASTATAGGQPGERRRRDTLAYRGPRNRSVTLHPGSALRAKPPKWIMAAELVETQRLYARTAAAIEPQWVEKLGAHLLKRSYTNPRFSRKAGRVVADEQTSLYGLVITPRRRVNYGSLCPQEARELFIRDGLVRGGLNSRAECLRHNLALMSELEDLEHKSRRRDILVDEERMFAFYDARLPVDIYDGRRFERWLKQAQREDPQVLHLSRDDLLREPVSGVGEADFPDHLVVGGLHLPLRYCFEPGRDEDGVTVQIPLAALNQLTAAPFTWLVPGLLREKAIALIKSLPKSLRRNFVPAPDFADACLAVLTPGEDVVSDALATQLERMSGVSVPASAWNEAALAPHLRMRFEVVDAQGQVLDAGRDLADLQTRLGERARAQFEALPETAYARSGLREWDFGTLPEVVRQTHAGVAVQGFPALVDEGDSVALRLMDRSDEAERVSHAGVRRLFMLALPDKVKYLRRHLPGLQTMCLHYAPVGGCEALKDDLLATVFDEVFLAEGLPRDAETFAARLEAGRGRLVEAGNALAAQIGAALAEYHAVARRLKGSVPPQWLGVLQSIREQLDGLIYPGFVAATPAPWRAHLPRFLQAIRVRLERLEQQPLRDREQARLIEPLWARYRQRCERGLPRDARWEAFRWLLEELRVSLFAQGLKTSQPVSVKRLQALLAELEQD